MSLSDERLEEIASSLGKSKVYGEITSALRELQSLRASRRPDMSDEAVRAARWLLDFLVPAGSHIGPVDEKALVVARALLSREAGCWQPIDTAPKDGSWIIARGNDGHVYRVSWGRNHDDRLAWCTVSYSFVSGYLTDWTPEPAGQPSADGGKEGD